MQTERIKEERVLLRIKKLDSMGRTREQVKAMELNDPPPLKLNDDTIFTHDQIAESCSEYPKALCKLALRNGLPAGDIANPDYPLPWDLAAQLGLDTMGFKVIGKNRESAGNVVVRLPYITRTVGKMNDDLTIDVESARKEEQELRRKGWVDSPSKLRGLPTAPAEQPFDPDPLPDGPGNQTGQATFKEAVVSNTAAQPAAIAPESPGLKSGEESNNQTGPVRKSKRGGARPGAGRKPKFATAAR